MLGTDAMGAHDASRPCNPGSNSLDRHPSGPPVGRTTPEAPPPRRSARLGPTPPPAARRTPAGTSCPRHRRDTTSPGSRPGLPWRNAGAKAPTSCQAQSREEIAMSSVDALTDRCVGNRTAGERRGRRRRETPLRGGARRAAGRPAARLPGVLVRLAAADRAARGGRFPRGRARPARLQPVVEARRRRGLHRRQAGHRRARSHPRTRRRVRAAGRPRLGRNRRLGLRR